MKREARLMPTDSVEDSFMKMAVDEAILVSVSEGRSLPTLRFYKWGKPAVAIGFFQSAWQELDVEQCLQDKVEIFRRISGGGAVYKDPKGEINYSFVVPESYNPELTDVMASYKLIGKAVVQGLRKLGIEAELAGINDIILKGRKISGNAQTRKLGAILQHGTVLLDFDVEKMLRYLKIPREKLSDKQVKEIRHRVGTIKEFFPRLGFRELEQGIIKGFERVFELSFTQGALSGYEHELAQKLYREKYSKDEWNLKR